MKSKQEQLFDILGSNVLTEEGLKKSMVLLSEKDTDEPLKIWDAQDGDKRTLLHYACMHSDAVQIIETLFEKKINPNLQDKYGDTPAHLACRNEETAKVIVPILAKYNVNFDIRNRLWENALYTLWWCIEDYALISLLLQKGASPKSHSKFQGQGLFQSAIDGNDVQLGLHLLFHGQGVGDIKVGNDEELLAEWVKALQLLEGITQQKVFKQLKLDLFEKMGFVDHIKHLNEEEKRKIIYFLLSLKKLPCKISKPAIQLILDQYLRLEDTILTKISDGALVKIRSKNNFNEDEEPSQFNDIARKGLALCSLFRDENNNRNKNNKRKLNELDSNSPSLFSKN